MPIMMLEHADETVLAVHDGFGASDVEELHDLLLRIERDRAVTIDFREVRWIEDFVLARLAPEFARRRIRALGLSEHQHRIMRYFAPESAAEPHEHQRSPGAQRAANAGGGVPVVLVVGDDADLRTMLSELLAAEGYEVREAANMAAATRHITDERPSVVLLDCAMPSAPMVLEWLRRNPLAAKVPVVAISDAERPPQGAIASLREPVEREALAATLKSVRGSVRTSEAKTS
jgi:CheY-like chemotaxis protein